MRGIYTDPEANPASSQPAYVLAAWIQEQLEDIHKTQIKRLLQLRARLQTEAFEWDDAMLAQATTALHSAGRELHFLPLRQGFIGRMLGRHRAANAQFIAVYDRVVARASQLKAELAELSAGYREHTSGARRVVVELDMEWKSLTGDVDQGVTWLQDMCTQLAHARTSGQDDAQLASLAEAAQTFTHEFKQLESAITMAHEIAVRAHNVLERRSALLEQLRADMETFDKAWMVRLGNVVIALKAERSAAQAIPKAIEAHDELMKRLAAAVDACGALQREEHLMAQHLGMLQQQLESGR